LLVFLGFEGIFIQKELSSIPRG